MTVVTRIISNHYRINNHVSDNYDPNDNGNNRNINESAFRLGQPSRSTLFAIIRHNIVTRTIQTNVTLITAFMNSQSNAY